MMAYTYFRQPIGSWDENATGKVWCGHWFDATGYARRYRIGSPAEAFHTGADLNCNPPGHFDADKLSAVYSIGDGEIVHAGKFPVWGNIIVARYSLEDQWEVYARYAHVDLTDIGKKPVKAGDKVNKGEQIARVGNAFNTMAFHLHFDLSLTKRLRDFPADWPKLDMARIRRDYTDPKIWLQARVPPAMFTPTRIVEVTVNKLFVRNDSSPTATIIGELARRDQVTLLNAEPVVNIYQWQRIAYREPPQWIATEYTKPVEIDS